MEIFARGYAACTGAFWFQHELLGSVALGWDDGITIGCSGSKGTWSSNHSSAGFDFAGDAVVLIMRDDVALHKIVGVTIRAVLDNVLGGRVVDARKRFEVVGRGAIDVDGALLLYTVNHTLNDRLGVTRRGRCGVGGLFANFIRAAIVSGATGKEKRDQQC